ncbi:MAG TPA: hypothetical protein VFB45_23670, partial [Pseudolabrys sp.]|nr:hypothetical protein [Pseudolabrys sp.]
MRRTSFTKILVTFGLIALMPASANALVTTYKNLTCKAHGYNQSGDARWDLTIKNTGRMTVPSRAGYHVRYISPNITFIAKLSPELKPAETRTTAT